MAPKTKVQKTKRDTNKIQETQKSMPQKNEGDTKRTAQHVNWWLKLIKKKEGTIKRGKERKQEN